MYGRYASIDTVVSSIGISLATHECVVYRYRLIDHFIAMYRKKSMLDTRYI